MSGAQIKSPSHRCKDTNGSNEYQYSGDSHHQLHHDSACNFSLGNQSESSIDRTGFATKPSSSSSLKQQMKPACHPAMSTLTPTTKTATSLTGATKMIGQHGDDDDGGVNAHLVNRSKVISQIRAAQTARRTNSTTKKHTIFGHYSSSDHRISNYFQQKEQHPIGLNNHNHNYYHYHKSNSNGNNKLWRYNFSQADAASAMVGLVRIILVILICVLLVKLHAIPGIGKSSSSGNQQHINSNISSKNQHSRRKRRTSKQRKTSVSQCESGNESGELTDRSKQITSQATPNKISNIHQQQGQHLSVLEIDNNIYKTNLGRLYNKFILRNDYATEAFVAPAKPLQRRLSQPVLMTTGSRLDIDKVGQPATSWQQRQAMNAHERRRRFSDTNAVIPSLKLPPGPTGLPFLGYLPFLGPEIHLTLTSLSQRFGPIYQIFLGGIRVVVLNDAALVRQAFKQTVFSGRPDTQLTRILQGYGIVNSDGALWKEQRAFLHSALRKLGAKSLMSGSNGLEAKIQNQVREFVNDLSTHANEGKPCQVRPIVARAVSSVVGSVVMNLTYKKYEEKFDRLIELMQEGFRLFSIAMPLDFIPIFRFLPGVSYAYKKMKRNRAETSAFFQGVADEHRQYLSETFNLNIPNTTSSLHPKVGLVSQANISPLNESNIPRTILTSDTITRTIVKQNLYKQQQLQQQQQCQQPSGNDNKILKTNQITTKSDDLPSTTMTATTADLDNIVARDLVDAYLVQQKKHEKDGKENYFSDQQLVQIMSDIFSAGLETVTSTIEWSILFLILNPECQEKIQIEIDKIVGRSRLPQLEDLAQMPYTEATIYEVLRRSNVVALGNAHATLADATIGGYRIPKGTQVLPNLYGIHMNPKLWDEPDRFDPSRFIVNDRAQKPDYFIPFSVGRRMCLGDVLAKMEVFLFLVGLLQKYDLSVHEDDISCPPKVKGTIGVSNAPVPFRVALKRRSSSISSDQQQ